MVAEIENPLRPGRYMTQCWISRTGWQGNMAVQMLRLLAFYVYGTRPGAGDVVLDADVEASFDPPEPDAAPFPGPGSPVPDPGERGRSPHRSERR